jgi:CheY-like chemotaxis protein
MQQKEGASRQCHQILLVEDNPGDVRLIRRALAVAGRCVELHVTHDGVEALAYLDSRRTAAQHKPDLILLDLSLPKMDGCEVLAQIRHDGDLRSIPVVILSSSQAEQDVIRSYEHNANCYITKPLDLEHYMQVIGSVQQYWLAMASLPRNGTHD